MLGGEYKHSLDPKNRIFIPSKLRDELGETFIVVKDIRERCLKVYSQIEWENYIEPIKHLKRELSERVFRFLHSSMAQVKADSQGRIVLPKELIDHADIEREIVIVGCYSYAEIWAEASYQKLRDEEDVGEMLKELEDLGL